MNILQSFKMAMKSIMGNKMRSFLTMLGIIIGVASVIILVSLVNGQMSYMTESFASMGTNQISVNVTNLSTRSVSVDEMYEFYEDNRDLFAQMTPNVTVSTTVKNGTESSTSTTVSGVSEEYLEMKDMELESGNIDCIWNGFTMTGREDNYTWTEAYMANTQVFVVGKDSGIASQADLAGKIVECQVDSSAEAALKEVPDLTATFKQLLTTADYNSAFMDLEQGAVDAIAMDVIVAGYQIQQRNADFIILEDSLSAEEYGVGFKKGNTELRDKVQATLEEMAADGTLKSVSEKWFGEDVTTIGK